jgi:RimJ/RimL family protein N-acetyltransferase
VRLEWDRTGAVAGWVARRIPAMEGTPGFPADAVSFCVLSSDGRPLGGVVYTDWQPTYRSIQISFASASPKFLTPRLLSDILEYPFGQLGCSRVTSITPSQTASALRFLNKFGFRREGLIRRGFGTDDAIISGLLAEEWAEHRFNVRRRGLTDGQALRPRRTEPDHGREPADRLE